MLDLERGVGKRNLVRRSRADKRHGITTVVIDFTRASAGYIYINCPRGRALASSIAYQRTWTSSALFRALWISFASASSLGRVGALSNSAAAERTWSSSSIATR